MKILGITDTITDSGIAYSENGRLIFALNEERLTRKKTQGGHPKKAIDYFVNNFPQEAKNIDRIVVAGILTPTLATRFSSKLEKMDKYEKKEDSFSRFLIDFIEYRLKLNSRIKPNSKVASVIEKVSEKLIRRRLPEPLGNKPISFIEHHPAHAGTAFHCSGFSEALVATFDGFGDGYSGKLFSVREGKFETLFSADSLDSFGLFYSMITELCGYKKHRHEGKITGLAAFGDSKMVDEKFPFKLTSDMKLKYTGAHGAKGLKKLKKKLSLHSVEDIAAWLQKNTEKYICRIISHYLKETKHENVCLAGGVFANVKLNQRIHELEEVRRIYIYPAMSDSGLSHGAILSLAEKGNVLKNVFKGPRYDDKSVEKALQKSDMKYERCQNIEMEIAEIIAEGNIVARFNGKMEYGPRALGNRSILVQATNPKINDILNKKLNRTEFMPFAPAIIDKFADKCVKNLSGAEFTSKFMNISFNVTEYMIDKCPAAVHVDKTARPQIVSEEDNRSFYEVLDNYYELTGIPAIINTSFNAHGEPIVMTPDQAIASFLDSDLDYLAINNFLVKRP